MRLSAIADVMKVTGAMVTIRLVCLAASIKHGGFCYAGKDVDTERWVRPVSDDEGHAITPYYRVVGRGDPAAVGDVLDMEIGAHVGAGYQIENYQHVRNHWRRIGRLTYAHAEACVDDVPSVWGDGRSTQYGLRDELTETEALEHGSSLMLIAVADLMVVCQDEGFGAVKMRCRADFTYRGRHYRLRITDPAHFGYAAGHHEIGEALLCCSLAEPFEWTDGSRHVSKLVAAIITRDMLG